ncbi:MAG TPA: chemotaxis protein CheW [Candidatus Dormibacteraeota bacterium]|nr:chemotaxis protein CheW [Candidatus Dormibacteraeota bacterium]
MTLPLHPEGQSLVLLRIGERRFALFAWQIAELVAPSRIFRFPHRTAETEGVILRRGRIIPVCDVSTILTGQKLTSRRFYLIAIRQYERQSEWIAIPVTGDCELINVDMTPAGPDDPAHITAWISHNGEVIEVLNVNALTPGPWESTLQATAARPMEVHP